MNEKITNEFLKYRKIISSLLNKIRPQANEQDIEDILQETYIKTYQSSLLSEIRYPKAFMVKVAIRLANRHISVAKRMDCDPEIDQRSNESSSLYHAADFSSQTERDVVSRKDFEFLCQSVSALPEQCGKVFVLKKVYGLSQREIATRLGISESTVEKHVAKGLLRITRAHDMQQATGQAEQQVADVQSIREAKKIEQ